MTRTVCFYHNDADGHASGAIVRYALGRDIQLFEMDYDARTIPWGDIANAGRVVVVDFSFPLQDMQTMAAGREFIWIDHHKSALTELEEVSKAWPGLRDLSEAACVLTWKYFFPNKPVPRAITLIGDRDIWRWAEADTGAFTEGLHVRDTSVEHDDLWVPILEDDPSLMKKILNEGQRLREIRLAQIKRLVEWRGFEVQFEGHQTLAINTHGNGDLGQHGRDLGYEIVYCYEDQMQRDILTTVVTLFSRQVDVSVIARRYGGGGHAGAAGFSFPRGSTPFPPEAEVKWLPQNRK
jgi:oligoribonuclease NrnB/cAMP/cGMP phosphodiesterase (DHH superfamily)